MVAQEYFHSSLAVAVVALGAAVALAAVVALVAVVAPAAVVVLAAVVAAFDFGCPGS